MNYVLHILCPFEATIKFFENGKEIFCVSTLEQVGDEISLGLENFECVKVFVYPHSKAFLPYSFSLNNQNNFAIKENFAKCFVLPENNLVLKLCSITTGVQEIFADKFEIENENLKKLTFLNDIAGRAKVEVFVANDNNLKKSEEFCVYVNRQTQQVVGEVVLLDFFESIFASDFKHAKSLLSQALSEKLDNETILTYFGNFCSCKLVSYFSTPAVVLFYENTAKVFACNLDNNKISDVYEIN